LGGDPGRHRRAEKGRPVARPALARSFARGLRREFQKGLRRPRLWHHPGGGPSTELLSPGEGIQGPMKIDRLELLHLKLPLVHFFETSFGRVYDHEVLIVRAESGGIVGYGEVPASAAPRYSYETVQTAWHILKDFLAPRL